ncbi:egg cell-secreted protein 1.3-like [Mangifera indica]|uniref:egg cell-secreted protein 1.3-like n=1 Tax=Mangifera indica TaxID=29780 RepID=UPI001CFB1509|nr:egg cell-secreted protein 1.3-like [Mangifera indica]
MAFKNVLLVLALITMALATSTAVRNDYNNLHIKPGYNLAERLVASRGLTECWHAFFELKSCTNEIILFFLNGEASLGGDCCNAVDIITRNCWPGMLISLGFTAEEGNLLAEYCDAPPAPGAAPPVADADADASSMINQPQVLV